jgi:glycosyltransferase involved in cell wall biosynthesis
VPGHLGSRETTESRYDSHSDVTRVKYQVLYVSAMCSQKVISRITNNPGSKPNLAPQKFHRLFAEGMAMQPDLFGVSTISVPPVAAKVGGKRLFTNKVECENGIAYWYAPIVLIPVLRNILIAFYVSLRIVAWRFTGNRNRLLLVDILNTSLAAATMLTGRLCGFRTVSIVTDLPEMMFILKERPSLANRLTAKIQNSLLKMSHGYIFLTEAMNRKVNLRGKPYFIMEGLSDIRMGEVPVCPRDEKDTKIVLYGGGLYAKFGVKMLLDAFTMVSGENYNLHLYGSGDMDNLIAEYAQKDPRIRFFGYVPTQVVVDAQLKATLLVNPRYANEEYTKYSFPSKNMEYMASGTPLATTKLPGMPEEYHQYVYLLEDETVDGFRRRLQEILAKPAYELYTFGLKAKEFVFSRKNNKVQAQRFHEFVEASFR